MKCKILFKYAVDNYAAGEVHELELSKVELGRLTRRGCVFASKEAKLTKKEKVVEEPKKVVEPKIEDKKPQETKSKIVSEHVVSKKDIKQAKVQTGSADKK